MSKYKLLAIIFFLLVIILLPSNGFSALDPTKPSINFDIANLARPNLKIFTDKEGLPQNDILTIVFDQKGYLWVGTDNGVAYYNGYRWTVIALPTKSSKRVSSILSTADGSMWFGTNDSVLKLKDGQWQEFTYANGSGSAGLQLYKFIEDKQEIILVSSDTGLFEIKNQKLVAYHPELFSEFMIANMLVTKNIEGNSVLWISSHNKGLIYFENGTTKVYNTSNGLPSNRVGPLLEVKTSDNKSQIWLGTVKGLVCLTQENLTVYTTKDGLPSDFISSLSQTYKADGKAVIWVGTNRNGLACFQDNKWIIYNTQRGLPDNHIVSLQADPSTKTKHLWIGTLFGGLVRMSVDSWLTFDTKIGLPSDPTFAFLETKSLDGSALIWIGTDNGIACLEKEQIKIYSTQDKLPKNWIFGLQELNSPKGKQICAGFDTYGIACLDNGKWQSYMSTDRSGGHNLIETSLLDGNPTLLVVNGPGKVFALIDGHLIDYTEKVGLKDKAVFFLTETVSQDGSRTLWAGTYKGLGRFRNGSWQFFDTTTGLPNNFVLSLLETTNKEGKPTLWVGTPDGVARCSLSDLDSGKPNWQIFSTKSHLSLPDDYIYQILEDKEKRIYLTTNRGVIQLTPKNPNSENDKEYSLYHFTIEDGLPSNECNRRSSMIDSQGRIWVGTLRGVAVFDPTSDVIDDLAKPLIFEKNILASKNRVLANGEVLTYSENSLTFEFTLLSYFRESDTRYRTQLIGLDSQANEWTSDHKKEYTTLPAGDYTFRVWAKDYAGNISGPIDFRFVIKTAPWYSWPAYIFYLFILGGIIYLLFNLRVQTLERRNQLLATKVAERTIELDKKNEELSQLIEELKTAKFITEEKVEELAKKNTELVESHKRADQIFSALANALPGTVLDGKYQLEDKIGAGGFGAVYRATHLSLNRLVAVKVFRPSDKNASVEALERFRLEGISACRVNHPNAITILDSGVSSESIAYLVMELLEGWTLSTELNKKHILPLGRVAQILIPVCDALAKAHLSGIIHRDIKPDNIFLHQSESGEVVKVVDFGIAKLVSETSEEQDLTGTGAFVGTPTHIAPERINGTSYDGRSDVYSLGITLYQMLAGRPPFHSDEYENPWSLVLAHLMTPPPPLREFNPNVLPEVEKIVMQTLEKTPNLRPTAKELAQDFAAALNIELEVNPSGVYRFSLNELLITDMSISENDIEPANNSQTTGNNIAEQETIIGENVAKPNAKIHIKSQTDEKK